MTLSVYVLVACFKYSHGWGVPNCKFDGNTIDKQTDIHYNNKCRRKNTTDYSTEGGENMDAIKSIIKNSREHMGFTQQQVADAAGVSRAYYADVERGRYTPSLKLLSRLGVILNIDLNFLKSNAGNTCNNITMTDKTA